MIKTVIAIGTVLALAGCATITRGSKDVLIVESTPAGAQVQMSNGQTCDSTPCTFKLPRKSELNVLVQKQGCKPQQIRVTNKVANSGGAAMAGNVLVGGIIGAGVDASSGAMLDLVPNPVVANLECR
ncbi:translation initiation factor 2 [Paracoccus zhejiangensis]|uniref:Translation initiation factor 2 n=1 Tax=Paracoccus zhejiangensis TaxID=1077935 RepID=A0A2H5F3V0_9RHOB|nr:translation initiation factor 2 [Paracoccus zhejiangensis]AUH66221.1 translation initiation factor 2 [Paracoccus zhejiangensis]